MIERKAYDALMRLAKQFPVIAITGPRQSGKSTLTKYAFAALFMSRVIPMKPKTFHSITDNIRNQLIGENK